MLQQTQVEQVIPYFIRFMDIFKNVDQLANAAEEQILKVWEGLGYYSRARNLHQSAKIIVNDFQSEIPRSWEDLKKLPGFGPYTTNAVLSIAFNQSYGVVDGNVKRVITRLFALKDNIRKPATHKKVQILMDSLLPSGNSARFNEAMMELGALVCQPIKPGCTTCPININCDAFQQGAVHKFPVKSKKSKIPTRESVAFILHSRGEYLLAKRRSESMLGGLWEFPTRHVPDGSTVKSIEKDFLSEFNSGKTTRNKHWPPINHTYTHFKLILHPILLLNAREDIRCDGYEETTWKSLREIKKLPMHRAIWKVLEKVEQDLIAITD